MYVVIYIYKYIYAYVAGIVAAETFSSYPTSHEQHVNVPRKVLTYIQIHYILTHNI